MAIKYRSIEFIDLKDIKSPEVFLNKKEIITLYNNVKESEQIRGIILKLQKVKHFDEGKQ